MYTNPVVLVSIANASIAYSNLGAIDMPSRTHAFSGEAVTNTHVPIRFTDRKGGVSGSGVLMLVLVLALPPSPDMAHIKEQ